LLAIPAIVRGPLTAFLAALETIAKTALTFFAAHLIRLPAVLAVATLASAIPAIPAKFGITVAARQR